MGIPATTDGFRTIESLQCLIRCYYGEMGHVTGGNLHIVLDDKNLEDDSIRFCREEAMKDSDFVGVAIADFLLKVPEEDREWIIDSAAPNEDRCCPRCGAFI